MLEKENKVRITNRSRGRVIYQIPDLGIRRSYEPGETKEVLVEEMIKLSYLPGGEKLIKKYLVMDNEKVVQELIGEVEPQYYYTEQDVKNLLLNGTLDQLKDCLDFANAGVIDLVKKSAVALQINDLAKRKAILDKTGFNVTSAIEINNASQDTDAEGTDVKTRRSAPMTTKATTSPARRSEPVSKYKVVSSKD